MTSPFRDQEVSPTTSLTQAAADGDVSAVRTLVAAGADVNSRNEGGQTALMLAALMGHSELATLLIEAGADPNLRDQLGLTAVEWAKRRGFSEIAQALVSTSPPSASEPEAKDASVAVNSSAAVLAQQDTAELEPGQPRVEPEQLPSTAEVTGSDLSEPRVTEAEPPATVDLSEAYASPAEVPHAEQTARGDIPEAYASPSEVLHAEPPARVDIPETLASPSEVPHPQPLEELSVSPAELYALGDIPKTDTTQTPVEPLDDQPQPFVIEPKPPPPVATQPAAPITQPVTSSAAPETQQDVTSDVLPSAPSESQLSEETQPRVQRPIHHEVPREPRAPAVFSRVEVKPHQAPQPSSTKATPSHSASTLGLATSINESSDVSGLRRCPKCNAVYENTWQLFCSRDRTPLIGGRQPQVTAPTTASSAAPIVVWLLIAFVLGASAFAAYRLTRYFYRPEPTAPVAAKPAEAPPEVMKSSFTVGGDLAGTELTIPEPTYPADLQNAGVSGPITVRVRVNKNGRVISTATSTGDRQLRAAASKAARLATFAPDKLAAAHPRSRVFSGTITYEFVPPSGTATQAPATTNNSAAEGTPNTDPNQPVVSSELASAARDIPSAEYPASARRAGVEGTVTVTVRVNRNGKVVSWRTEPGNSQLRAAAIRAARKATFSSDKLPGNGDTLGTITYTFKP